MSDKLSESVVASTEALLVLALGSGWFAEGLSFFLNIFLVERGRVRSCGDPQDFGYLSRFE